MPQRPTQIIPVQTNESPLVQALLGLTLATANWRALHEDSRRQSAEDRAAATDELNKQLQQVQLAQTSAAQTPIEQAPQIPFSERPAAQGVPPLLAKPEDVPPEPELGSLDTIPGMDATTPKNFPQRDIMITTKDGKRVPLRPLGVTLPPLQYKQEVEATRQADTERQQLATGAAVRITPDVLKSIPTMYRGLFPEGQVVDKSMLTQLMRNRGDLQYIQKTDEAGRTVSGFFDKDNAQITWLPPEGPATNGMDQTTGEEFLKSLPPDRRNLVTAIGEGRQPMPATGNRPNSPGYTLMLDVYRAFPNTDQQVIKARYTARNDLAKGSSTSRGQTLTSLNQLSRHLNEMEDASDEMEKQGWSTHDIETLNKMGLAAFPKGKQTSVTNYTTAAAGVENEYIKALSGGVPTDAERKALDTIHNPALPRQNREAAMNTMRQFAQARMNAQEDWYQQTFGKPSAEDNNAFRLGPNWRNVPGSGWQILSSKEMAKTPAAAPKPSAAPTPQPSAAPTPQPSVKPSAAPGPQASASPRPAMPKIGAVVRGYRYKGGDPAKQESWEKVQ